MSIKNSNKFIFKKFKQYNLNVKNFTEKHCQNLLQYKVNVLLSVFFPMSFLIYQ